MKLSEVLTLHVDAIKNNLPASLQQVKEMTASCAESEYPVFVELGAELARKEAVFVALGMFTAYFDMLDMLVKIIKLSEEMKENGAAH
jgi:hypothetical protein